MIRPPKWQMTPLASPSLSLAMKISNDKQPNDNATIYNLTRNSTTSDDRKDDKQNGIQQMNATTTATIISDYKYAGCLKAGRAWEEQQYDNQTHTLSLDDGCASKIGRSLCLPCNDLWPIHSQLLPGLGNPAGVCNGGWMIICEMHGDVSQPQRGLINSEVRGETVSLLKKSLGRCVWWLHCIESRCPLLSRLWERGRLREKRAGSSRLDLWEVQAPQKP